jgi:hypothetical protein
MKFKAVLLALAAAFSAGNALALTTAIFPTGPDDSIHIGDSFKSKLASTTDLFTFTITETAYINGSLSATALGNLQYDFTSVFLDGPGSHDFSYVITGPLTKEHVDITDSLLVPGAYTLRVLGKTLGTKGGSWGGDLNLVAAVPEPETYALLAGGLAGLAFVSRRRR